MKNGIENNIKNYKIKNIVRFCISILLFVILIIVLAIIIKTNSKVRIDENTQLDNLNVKKYSKEISSEYNKDGQIEMFLKDYDSVQTQVAMYILNNSTLEENSFKKIKSNLQAELNQKVWKNFELQKPTHWNGEWLVDDSGVLKFKFQSSAIEPNWIDDVASKVIKNDGR